MQIISFLFQFSWLSLTLPIKPISNTVSPNKANFNNLYVITTAYIDSLEYSEEYYEKSAFINFYEPPFSDEIHMSNSMSATGTRSCGKITNIELDSMYSDNNIIYITYFDWHYTNNYDAESGVANIIFFTTVENNEQNFSCLMFLGYNKKTYFSGPIVNIKRLIETESLPILINRDTMRN